MNRRFACMAALAAAALSAGCGQASRGGFAFAAGDGGAGDGGGKTGDGGGGAAKNSGYVTLYALDLTVAGMRFQSGTLSAGFLVGPGANPACTETAVGVDCRVMRCPLQQANPDGGATVHANAGIISMTGGVTPASIMFDGTTYPSFSSPMAPLWNGGEVLSITAAGGDVPAFLTMVTAPVGLSVVSPAAPQAGQPMMVTRASGIDLAWTGGVDSTVLLQASYAGNDGTVTVSCELPGAASAGSIPAAALAQIPTGIGSLSVQVRNLQKVRAGDWEVSIGAYAGATTEGKDRVYTIQADYR